MGCPSYYPRHRSPLKCNTFTFSIAHSSVKHWLILIIFGMQHKEKNLTQMSVVLATSPQCCCYTTM